MRIFLLIAFIIFIGISLGCLYFQKIDFATYCLLVAVLIKLIDNEIK